MRRARYPRGRALILLAGLAGEAGCTHNYYYGTAMPPCTEPETVRVGSVCDVPGQVVSGRTVVTQVAPPGSSRVVISEPRVGPPAGSPRLGWRRSDPESLATSSVEG